MSEEKDKRTAPQNRNDNAEAGTGAYEQRPQPKSKVLGTDKATTTTNPLRGSLSEKPEEENKVLRDNKDIGEK